MDPIFFQQTLVPDYSPIDAKTLRRINLKAFVRYQPCLSRPLSVYGYTEFQPIDSLWLENRNMVVGDYYFLSPGWSNKLVILKR